MTGIPVTIVNQLDLALTVYNAVTPSPPPSAPPSTDAATYQAVHTPIGSVPANGQATLTAPAAICQLVICGAEDQFPLQQFITPILATAATTTVTATDRQQCQQVHGFIQQLFAQPYAPVALQFNALLSGCTSPASLEPQVAAFFNANGLPGCTFAQCSIVGWWLTNCIDAWDGTYYCYLPPPPSGELVLPNTPCAMLSIAGGKARFAPTDPSQAPSSNLAFADGVLGSPQADAATGLYLTALPRELRWEGQPGVMANCFVGTWNGKQMIAQTTPDPSLPWWVGAYDLVYVAFQTLQLAMTLQMIGFVFSASASALAYVGARVGDLVASINRRLSQGAASADADAAAGADAEAVNVDVDTDTDTDIVDVTDTVDTDTDTDTDVDVDIDVDDDVFAVIDTDVDTDVDIDTDTDIDDDTDTDTDIDTDIDTDVPVQPSAVLRVLTKLGGWLMDEGFPLLVKNLVILGALISAQRLLAAWGGASDQALAQTAPEQSTGLGLLLNYMLNPNNSPQTRWQTFADLVAQARPDAAEQTLLLDAIVTTADPAADQAAAAWRWPDSTRESLVMVLAQYSGDLAPGGYQILGAYTDSGQPLPIKTAAEVALSALALADKPTPGVSYRSLQVFHRDQDQWIGQPPYGLRVAAPGGLAFATFNDKLYLAYTGFGRLLCLLLPSAKSGSSDALDQQLVLPYSSIYAPTLVSIGGCLLLLFVGDGDAVYGCRSTDGIQFSTPERLLIQGAQTGLTSRDQVGACDLGQGELGVAVLCQDGFLRIYCTYSAEWSSAPLDCLLFSQMEEWDQVNLGPGFGAAGTALACGNGQVYLAYTCTGPDGSNRLGLAAGAYPGTRPAALTLAEQTAVDSGLALATAEDGNGTPSAAYVRAGRITIAAPGKSDPGAPIPIQLQTLGSGAQPALCDYAGRAYLAYTVPAQGN